MAWISPDGRGVVVHGKHTRISLEQPFWEALKTIAVIRHTSVAKLVSEIDKTMRVEPGGIRSLSSAVRIFVMQHCRLDL